MAFRGLKGLPSILKRRKDTLSVKAVDEERLLRSVARAGVETGWARDFFSVLRKAKLQPNALKAAARSLIHGWKINPDLAHSEPRGLARAYMADSAVLAPATMRKSILAARERGVRTTPALSGVQDSLFTCGRRGCRSQRTAHWQRQSRSADEGMTVTVECLDCGFRYKV